VRNGKCDWAIRVVVVVCRKCERVFAFEEVPEACPFCSKTVRMRETWSRALSGGSESTSTSSAAKGVVV
jgi:hypothetical protein